MLWTATTGDVLPSSQLCTFQKEIRYRVEKLAFDTEELSEVFPHTNEKLNHSTFLVLLTQLQAIRQEIDFLINDVALCSRL